MSIIVLLIWLFDNFVIHGELVFVRCCMLCYLVTLGVLCLNICALFHYLSLKFNIFQADSCLIISACTRGISYRGRRRGLLTCYPHTDLSIAKELMEARGIKQLPVVKPGGETQKDRKRKVVGIIQYESIRSLLRF